MSVEELLAQLKDIQPPLEPGWWPLALGWWYLFGLIALLWITLWFLRKRKQAGQPVVFAAQELEKIKNQYLENNNDNQLALSLSAWLKRVCLYAFPDHAVAGLTGRPWLEFLDNSLSDNEFSDGAGQIFANSIYSAQSKINPTAVINLCEKWLSAIEPELIKQGQI